MDPFASDPTERDRLEREAPRAPATRARGPQRPPKPRRRIEGRLGRWSQIPQEAVLDIVPQELDQPPVAEPPVETDAQALLGAVEQMRHLAELGRLATVVAHGIRNPLASIAATAEVLHDTFDEGDERRESSRAILDETRRLDGLARHLLDLDRSPRLMATDIADDIDSVARGIADEARRAGVQLLVEHPDKCTPVRVDSELIQRALGHVAANALEAMPRGGTLTIRTLRPDTASAFVCVEVADTGPGIAAEALPRIFEPFFTTRPDHVGLGLAAARKLVERQGGHVTCEGRPGRGACFTLYLPRDAEARS